MNEPTVGNVEVERLLRAPEVATLLSISDAKAYSLMQQGEIRCVRIGKAVRVRPTDLQLYIQSNLTEKPFPG